LGGSLSAFEVMWNNFYTVVTSSPSELSPPLPRDYPYYVLVEAMGSDDVHVESVMTQAYEQELVVDAVISQSEAQRLELWALRDSVELLLRFKPSFTFDVSMRISDMLDYITEVNEGLEQAFEEFYNFTFGHMADGNLHLVVSVPAGPKNLRQTIENCVYQPLAAIQGSVSAEHGVGLEKKPYLELSRTIEEIQLMRRLKHALDPNAILNPGKIFDPVSPM